MWHRSPLPEAASEIRPCSRHSAYTHRSRASARTSNSRLCPPCSILRWTSRAPAAARLSGIWEALIPHRLDHCEHAVPESACPLLFIFSHISSVRMKWVWASAQFEAFGREPVRRRLAKCDASSSRTGGFFPPRRGFSAFGWRTASAFFRVVRTSAQRGLFLPRRAHTRSRGKKPHTAATRASRRGAGARHTRRVDRADCFHGQKIGTFGTLERNPPFAVAAVGISQNSVFS